MGLCNFSGRLRVDFEVPWGLSGAIQLSRVNVPLDFVALRFAYLPMQMFRGVPG